MFGLGEVDLVLAMLASLNGSYLLRLWVSSRLSRTSRIVPPLTVNRFGLRSAMWHVTFEVRKGSDYFFSAVVRLTCTPVRQLVGLVETHQTERALKKESFFRTPTG